MNDIANLGEEEVLGMRYRRLILDIVILKCHFDIQSEISNRQIRYRSIMPYSQLKNP